MNAAEPGQGCCALHCLLFAVFTVWYTCSTLTICRWGILLVKNIAPGSSLSYHKSPVTGPAETWINVDNSRKLAVCCVCVCAEALRDMQAVAEHMNEMQKIYDEYGAVFDALSSDGVLHCRVCLCLCLASTLLFSVNALLLRRHWFYCRAMLCISAAYAVMRCLCVCVCVTFVNCVKTNKHSIKMFSLSGSRAILVLPCQTV